MHRVLPILAVLALLPLHIGVMCEGWQSTAEARMACCAPGGECDMHGIEQDAAALTQAQADQCCALSTSSASRAPEPVALLSVAVPGRVDRIHAAQTAISRPLAAIWRTADARPPGHVPKHVLLSVFLV